MILHFAYAGAALIALALIAAWMFIVSRRSLVMRVGGCIIALLLAAGAWINITAMLGYAVPDMPVGRLQVAGIIDDVGHGKIYLWLKQPDGPRAFVVPYSEGLASSLMQALRKAHETGGRIMLENPGGRGGISGIKGGNQNGIRVDVEPTLPPKS